MVIGNVAELQRGRTRGNGQGTQWTSVPNMTNKNWWDVLTARIFQIKKERTKTVGYIYLAGN